MSRDYSAVSPQFWVGETGHEIRQLGHEAMLLAVYLMTCPSANMIGLYYLPISVIANDIGSTIEGASVALRRVCETGFCGYEARLELVFLPEMARWQIGSHLKAGDKRVKYVIKELAKYFKSIFYNQFLDRYETDFSLTKHMALLRAYEAPPKPRSGSGSGSVSGSGSSGVIDEIEKEVRKIFRDDTRLTHSPKAETALVRLVKAVGWPATMQALDTAFANTAADPVHYAVKVATTNQVKEAAKPKRGEMTDAEWERINAQVTQ